MLRDQQERHSLYLVVIDGQRPRFGEWSIDYRFAAGSRAAPAGPASSGPAAGSEGGAGFTPGQLPPDIVADRYLLQAEQAVRSGDPAAARAAMKRLQALQREHGL